MNVFVFTICHCYLPIRMTVTSEGINVIDESQAENRPVPMQEAEIRWKKGFFGRPLCLLCLAAAQEITHAYSLSRL